MSHKDAAIQQIDEIYNTIRGNLKTMFSWSLMVAVGIGVMAIPAIEWVFNNTLNVYLAQRMANPDILLFIVRTLVYWTFFSSLSVYFKKPHKKNMLLTQVFEIGKLFPLIPIATGAALGVTNNDDLISPMILVLIGTLFVFYGQFTSRIVSTIAWSIIIAGIGGILLVPYAIPHLWAYLIMYQGLGFIIMGCVLRHEQNNPTHE